MRCTISGHMTLFSLNCTQSHNLPLCRPVSYSCSRLQVYKTMVNSQDTETHNIRINFKLDAKYWTAAVDAAQALNFLCRFFKPFLRTDMKTKNITSTLQTSAQQTISAEANVANKRCHTRHRPIKEPKDVLWWKSKLWWTGITTDCLQQKNDIFCGIQKLTWLCKSDNCMTNVLCHGTQFGMPLTGRTCDSVHGDAG